MHNLTHYTDRQLIELSNTLIDNIKLPPQPTPVELALLLKKNYVKRTHLTAIGNAMATLLTGQHDRLIINMPPRAGKTETAAIYGAIWWLTHHPDHSVVIASYADSLAEIIGKTARETIRDNAGRLGFTTKPGSESVKAWKTTTGGGIRSVGYGSGLTGHGADLLICDDPHKDRAEASSPTKRDNIWNWWSSTALSRLSPDAPIILIMTRWHPDDLAARIIKQEGTTTEGGRWLHLNMPAIAESHDDPLGRAIGEPLTHPKIGEHDHEKLAKYWANIKKTTIPSDWHSLYQNNPKPREGALLTERQLEAQRHYLTAAKPLLHAVAIDPSGGGRDTAGIIGGYLGEDKRLYITHDRTITGPADLWSREACQLAADIDADRIIAENNYGADMARMVIRTAWETLQRENPDDPKYQRHAPRIIMVHAKKGKLLRAEPIAQQWVEDHIRTGAPVPDVEHEWSIWLPTDTDSPGRIDASTYLAYDLLPVPGAEIMVSTPAGRSKTPTTRTPRGIAGRSKSRTPRTHTPTRA